MTGFTLGPRETALLRDIVDATRVQSDLPLPWLVLEKLKELLEADSVQFVCLDSSVPRIVFQQDIEPSDEQVCWSEAARDAAEDPFWIHYWGPMGCGYPDVSGDYRYVRRASDRWSLREQRAMLASRGDTDPTWERYLETCLPGRSPGRYFRVGAFRGGRDFSERHVFLMQLLQPHLEQAFWAGTAAHRAVGVLTPRQLEVMRMVRAGLSNRQIARRVGITEGTVHVHLTNIFERLGVQSRTAAVHQVFDIAEDWATPLST
jgi:DNA-binding CsgD family transcriptional regulator